MTKLKFVNMFIMQWFCIRLTKQIQNRVEQYELTEISMMQDSNASMRGTGLINQYSRYSIMYWIVPCTGWKTNFRNLNKCSKFIALTKYKQRS